MDEDKSIDVLNKLITINNDRIEGYDKASAETDEQDLKTLFDGFSETSRRCKTELVNEVEKLDGTIAEGTKTTGKFFRVWMDAKAALTGKDRKAILNSCEFGEDKAVETYDKVLTDHDSGLTAQQQTLVKGQRALIKADHDTVKSLRDALVEVE
jgi:uncharacterized protein (TIGR02284 family)